MPKRHTIRLSWPAILNNYGQLRTTAHALWLGLDIYAFQEKNEKVHNLLQLPDTRVVHRGIVVQFLPRDALQTDIMP